VRRSVWAILASQDNTADFLFPTLPVIIAWGAPQIDPGGADESIAVCRALVIVLVRFARAHVRVSPKPIRQRS
jgi:hypothetical protein